MALYWTASIIVLGTPDFPRANVKIWRCSDIVRLTGKPTYEVSVPIQPHTTALPREWLQAVLEELQRR